MSAPAVDVWWARLSRLDELASARTAGLLDVAERGRAAAYVAPDDRLRFQLGVAITRLVLAQQFTCTPGDVRLDRTCPDCARPHGKVRVLGPQTGWELSVSHSGDLVGVAASTVAPVGLDVEELRPVEVESMAPLVLTESERLECGAATTDFLRYWTRKEAVVKSTGDGLRRPLSLVSVTRPSERAAVLAWAGREEIAAKVSLYDLADREGHLASLAVLSRAELTVTEHDAEPLLQRWADG